MSASAATASKARPWNPNFTHSDRERWICIYPAYINSKKTLAEGRRIVKAKAVDNPTYAEIRDVCAAAGLNLGVEDNVYPREIDPRDMRFRGRIRVQLRDDNGTPINDMFPSRDSLLLYLGDMIPKLKARQQSANASAAASQQQNATGSKKKKGGKKR